ncbi:LINE-1 retrotransposable element ORF2 protein [Holothuria leucospilota]|uniref:LINE-1 retrotransposable element ORF2 protein n=1 Tax=Holothuria leucospilota TaxID=206669 RepID=A0A9Q1HCR5_HOLLE|nr:LINE-1 retrotransposable element ORF2 protein [Holothuria leucospilota]
MLGIAFTHNGDDLFRLNYQPKLSRLKNTLRVWASRDLTPIGRNIIVKTFGLSQLVYLFLVLPKPPKTFIKELDCTIFDFIWGGNPDKVKRSAIINPVSSGGLKVTHISSFINSLKCTWIQRYCTDLNGPWKTFFHISLKKYGYDFLFKCNCKPNDVKNIRNTFVREIAQSWCNISYVSPKDNYGSQILWNNSDIRMNGEVIF